MRKLFFLILLSSVISMLFISCNKDDAVSPGGGGSTPVIVTNTFPKTSDVQILFGETNDTLNIDSSGTINSLSFALNNIETVNAVNVDIFLLHGGVTDTLLYRTTNNGTSFSGTIFSDTASTSIQNGSGDFTGFFRPYSPLSKFNGLNINGQWILKFISRVAERTGVIKSWGITITYNRVQTPTTVLMPLAIGNSWTLEVRDTLGNFIENKTVSVPYSILLNGKTVYRWYMSWNSDTIYLWNENDGVWMHRLKNGLGNSGLAWKYPVSPGERWSWGSDTAFCLSINETVITPMGTYSGCIKYKCPDKYNALPSFAYHYLKPGLGMIEFDYYDNFNYLHERWKLVSYVLY